MTEKTEHNASRRYIIDPVAFFGALIGGLILFTVATFWIMLILVAALAIGAICYLLIGAPVLMIHLRRYHARVGNIAWAAILGILALYSALAVFVILASDKFQACEVFIVAPITFFFGALFSTCWGATSGWLYRALARDLYLHAETY